MIGLDTCAIIDLFKGDNSIKSIIQKNEIFCATTLSYLELQFGMDPDSKIRQKEQLYYDRLFIDLMHLRLNFESCKKASWAMQPLFL